MYRPRIHSLLLVLSCAAACQLTRAQVAQEPPPAQDPAPASAAAAPLDLSALEQRLKDTSAIGLFTKLSLKNQVDDLVAQFRAFHRGSSPPTLSELRRRFELLVIKVVTLVQDDDPSLAAAISASREALWALLSDPKKFSNI
jgi:hypothetical protein